MQKQNEHFRHIAFYYFKKGKRAADTHRKLCRVYGVDAITERTCQIWFTKFRSENFLFQDVPRSGRSVQLNEDQLKAIIENDRHITVREIAKKLNLSKTTIDDHLRNLGYSKKLDIWVPHKLVENQLIQRINICDMLFKRNQIDPFLKNLITGDEKWIVYNNVNRKRSWSKSGETSQRISKPDIHQKKVMLSIWWDYKGIIYFELLPSNKTIDSNVYCQQLSKLNDCLHQKRPNLVNRARVVFHHYNARPHTSLVTRQKLLELGWDVLPHPSYSPDMAPTDYHLFLSLQNSLAGKTFASDDTIKTHLNDFFAGKDQKFYEAGIMKLPERWKLIVEQNGDYVI
jgi:histone-lysine N-methyltransferase SETMAR